MGVLVSVDEFRQWAGISPTSASDDVLAATLDEAEAGLAADVGDTLAAIMADQDAVAIGSGEVLRRANRLLARRNSPESVLGAGVDGILVTVPARDPDSQRSVWSIQAILDVPQGVW